MEHSARSPSPITEEADDDDDSSSAYGRTIKRIMQKTKTAPELTLKIPSSDRYNRYSEDDHSAIEMTRISGTVGQQQYDFENRSLYSINESEIMYENSSFQVPSSERFGNQFESSFTIYDNDLSSTNNQQSEFSFHTNNDDSNKPPHFARRYFYSYNTTDQVYNQDQDYAGGQDRQSGDYSESSEPDLNTKWSWKNLKREFKLSHSESLFHLYQAKLQHSFFVALLILNIIFNLGAVISYSISKYHEMNIYLILMRLASIVVFISFLILIWFNKLWMQSKFSRTVASLAVLMAMIFGEASK